MKSNRFLTASLAAGVALAIGASSALLGVCGPFTDVSDVTFCPFVLEIFYLGITSGTTATTYDPTSSVSRLQMAAFLSRSVDGALRRGSRRAPHDQFFTPQNATVLLGQTTVGTAPLQLRSDGADVWVANTGSGTVSRVRSSDGRLLETWTGATAADPVMSAVGRIFVGGTTNPGNLYMIDPGLPAGAVTTVATNLGNSPNGLSFDGTRIYVASGAQAGTGSVSLVTPGPTIPWTVTTVTTGFSTLAGAVFDGTNVWVTDPFPGKLFKLNSSGAIAQTVFVGNGPLFPAFDGTNIWVPNSGSDSLSIVRASSGVVLQTLTGNGLSYPTQVAFDGQRMLVTNQLGDSVSLWKAADLTALQTVTISSGGSPFGATSDGLHFWVTLSALNKLVRF